MGLQIAGLACGFVSTVTGAVLPVWLRRREAERAKRDARLIRLETLEKEVRYLLALVGGGDHGYRDSDRGGPWGPRRAPGG